MRALFNKLVGLYDQHPRAAAIIGGVALLVGLTTIHAFVAFTSAFRPLYVLPIWLATRIGGRMSGLALVVLSTLVGTMTEWQLGHAVGESIVSNMFIRFL